MDGGGALGGVGKARRWLWPRRTASVATGAFGRKEQRRGERLGEREGVQGGSASPWRRLGASERGQAGREGGGGRRGRARASTQLLRGEGRKTMEGLQWWAGPHRSWAGWATR